MQDPENVGVDLVKGRDVTGVIVFEEGKVTFVANFRADHAIKRIAASQELYRDLLYVMTVLRTLQAGPLDVVERELGEPVDFDRVMRTLRKAGYEQTEWPLCQVSKNGGSEG